MTFLNRYAFQAAGALIAVGYLIDGILKSTNSTAFIGFLFILVAAGLGAFAGDAVKYALDVLRKKRPHSTAKTLIILAAVALCAYRFARTQMESRNLQLAENHSTPAAQLIRLLQSGDARIIHAVAANSSLPVENLEAIVREHLTDAYVMSGVVRHPGLSASKMEEVVSLERRDFTGDAEYEVYQTYVWAPLARRKDIPEALIHKLAAKKNPEHFLILALLESPFVSCDEAKRFLPQPNQVLESAIRRSMEAKKCTVE